MRKFIGFSALLVMLFALPAFAADTIKIGEIATVTGDFAAYGVAEVTKTWSTRRAASASRTRKSRR